MLTIQDLINKLSAFPEEMRDLPIGQFCKGNRDGPDSLLLAQDVKLNANRVYDHSSHEMNQYKEVLYLDIKWGEFY